MHTKYKGEMEHCKRQQSTAAVSTALEFYINALSRPSSSPLQTCCCDLTTSTLAVTIAKPHHSESLLVIHKLLLLTLSRNLKAFLGRVQNQLDLLDQAILLLLDLGVLLDSLLDE